MDKNKESRKVEYYEKLRQTEYSEDKEKLGKEAASNSSFLRHYNW